MVRMAVTAGVSRAWAERAGAARSAAPMKADRALMVVILAMTT